MTRRSRVTIRDVARGAGVSTQTVSRVLNDRPDVAPDTVVRVRQVIAEMGYSPNLLARGLTQGRTHILGVVAYGLEYFGPSRILSGIEQQAAAMGYSMMLMLVHRPSTDTVDGLLVSLMSRQVDGVIWAIPDVAGNRASVRRQVQDLPVPLVLVGGAAARVTAPSFSIDNQAIGRLATEHLLAGGSRRIAVITGPLDWWESQQRVDGWRRSMMAARMGSLDGLVVEGDWTAASGEEGLHRLLRESPGVDAVFASNDQMALGVLHAAHRLGLRVPEDLAVVGVDDIAEGSHYWPPLTTVHQPLRDAGVLAVEAVLCMIGASRHARTPEEPDPPSRVLQPTLIVRQSTRRVTGT